MNESQAPEGLLYDGNNFWVKIAGKKASVGLTPYGQGTIGDILYLELVSAGTAVRKGEKIGSVESGKWVGTLVAPLTGIVLQTNREVEAEPRLVNVDPYGQGWLIIMECSDPDELEALMDGGAYQEWVKQQVERESREAI